MKEVGSSFMYMFSVLIDPRLIKISREISFLVITLTSVSL